MAITLSHRAEVLLRALVEHYIADGQPVGSRTLARQSGLDLSPATIRNIMADLEDYGLVRSPHTSAGRIPTQLGYRLFVDTLIKFRTLDTAEIRKLEEELHADQDPNALIESASQLLSEITHLAGVVMVPRRDNGLAFRHIDFVRLSGRRVLVILVTRDGQLQNRIINAAREYSDSELTQAANYFNDTYAGHTLGEVKQLLVRELRKSTEDMHRLMALAVEMAGKMFRDDDAPGDELLVSGEANLMENPDLGDVHTLRRLFDAFNTKRDLLQLLDQSVRAGGVRIFIGSESGYDALQDCSVVTAPYHADGQVVGTLGVIGPTRMSYEYVIPIVDVTARLLGLALGTMGR